MEIVLNKEDFSNGIKIVEKITAQKAIQPILSNILIETIASDRVRFCATDLNLAINYKTSAEVIKEGSITLSAKKISEIVSKLSSTDLSKVKSIVQGAASEIGLTVTFNSKGNGFTVSKGGKTIDVITSSSNSGKLVYTGSNTLVLVIASLGFIAVAGMVVAKLRK